MTEHMDSQSPTSDQETSTQVTVEVISLDDLIPFPDQATYFGDTTGVAFADLVTDIKRRGLIQLPEILPENNADLPENTILLGHQRVRALRKLGHTEYDVVVRYDLAEATREEIEYEFLMDNHARRHQEKLGIARVAKRLLEIERMSREKRFYSSGKEMPMRHIGEESRDVIGKRFGISGRTLDRWLKVLELPIEIQKAVDEGKLGLTKATNLASLKKSQLTKIAAAIRKGETPNKVVARYAPKPAKKEVAAKAAQDVVKALSRALDVLPNQLGNLSTTPSRDDLEVLEKAKPLIDKLSNKLKKNEAVHAKKLNEMLDDLDLY